MDIYLKILKKNLTLILVFSIIVTFVVGFLTLRQPVKYDVSLSISVSRVSSPEYAGFYSGQASKLFTDTIASWLRAPEIVADIYKEAGLEAPVSRIRGLSTIFKLEGSASQHLKISFQESSQERAAKVAAALPRVIQENNNTLFAEGNRFSIVATEPLILERKPPLALNIVISFLVTAAVLFFLALIIEYFKEYKYYEEKGRD